ncbi:hypothetical protein SCLCIDRAFT_1010512 [Scleroderma citrinum Foug A]|uniref:Uncharacterized protein n=1 Tax=Scleroderma citrinum Foug A TaxID=1036808 RepID=A0A0C3ATC6_9AGAM|nr:hypothetical protein SCLCIDRAFT_1010512 [Scleroderma citrinum Foug A]
MSFNAQFVSQRLLTRFSNVCGTVSFQPGNWSAWSYTMSRSTANFEVKCSNYSNSLASKLSRDQTPQGTYVTACHSSA